MIAIPSIYEPFCSTEPTTIAAYAAAAT